MNDSMKTASGVNNPAVAFVTQSGSVVPIERTFSSEELREMLTKIQAKSKSILVGNVFQTPVECVPLEDIRQIFKDRGIE